MSDYNEGDLIEAVKGESVVRGRLRMGRTPRSGNAGYRYVGDSAALDEVHLRDGWTITVIEKAKPKLPTEPGSVIQWQAVHYTGLAVLEKRNQWLCGDRNFTDRMLLDLMAGADFIKLEPVAETAEKVLGRVRGYMTDDPTFWGLLDRIAADYGVRS